MKKVSVIITTYGGGNEVERAITSVLNQSYENYEIIVVDDNGIGTDTQIKTKTLLQNHINSGKIKYIAHEFNKNGSATRNTGFENSCGEYVMFLDDDDEYTNNRIENQVAILEGLDESFGVSYCSLEKYEKNGNIYEKVNARKSGNLLYNVLMHKPDITTSSVMFRRKVYCELGGFDESFQRHQDWELITRAASEYKFAAMKKVGLIVHMEFRNLAKNLETLKANREKYLEKVKPQIDNLNWFLKNRVIAENLYDIPMQHLKTQGIKGFLREYKKIKMGYFGVEFLIRRFYFIMKRNIQRIFLMKGYR